MKGYGLTAPKKTWIAPKTGAGEPSGLGVALLDPCFWLDEPFLALSCESRGHSAMNAAEAKRRKITYVKGVSKPYF